MIKGAVTFLDVLGWKGIWQRRPDAASILLDIIKNSSHLLEKVREEEREREQFPRYQNDDVQIISISDTIVILTEGPDSTTLPLHGLFCSMLMVEFLKNKFLVRGATGFGEYNNIENIFVGPVIDEIASWYESADWIGIIQTPSAYFTSICPNGLAYNLEEHDVSLKTKGKIKTRCVNWVTEWINQGKDELDLRDLFVESGPISPEIYYKYMNTMDFYKKLENKYSKEA